MRLLLWHKIGIYIVLLTGLGATFLFISDQLEAGLALMGAGLFFLYLLRRSLARLDSITMTLEGVAEGDLKQPRITVPGDDEIGRLAGAVNKVLSQLRGISNRAEDIAEGRIGVREIEDRVMESGRLAEGDVSRRQIDNDLDRKFTTMTNQLRRLTIQARVIADGELSSSLLDERIRGELGEAFGLMVKRLQGMTERAKRIAHGDLSSHLGEGEGGDLNEAFDEMVEGLTDVVQQIVQTAVHISTAADEILVVLREQELAASHQASSVEETQRTMETLLSSAKKIAESAQTVFKSAEKTLSNNRTIAQRTSELKAHTERISEILETIKSIADRSDLLALNASLEGLRAGEAGKGFTLVAAEMRRLAENIKGSVGDVKELLSDIRESSLASVMATEEGTRLAERTTESALKITLITQQQQSGTEQVTQSMEELSHLINQGLAGTQQVTTAASELAELSDDLRHLVEKFDIDTTDALSAELAAAPRLARARSGLMVDSSMELDFGSGELVAADVQARRRPGGRDTEITPISGLHDVEAAARADAEARKAEEPADDEAEPPLTREARRKMKETPVGMQVPEASDRQLTQRFDIDQPLGEALEDESLRERIREELARHRDGESSSSLDIEDVDEADIGLILDEFTSHDSMGDEIDEDLEQEVVASRDVETELPSDELDLALPDASEADDDDDHSSERGRNEEP